MAATGVADPSLVEDNTSKVEACSPCLLNSMMCPSTVLVKTQEIRLGETRKWTLGTGELAQLLKVKTHNRNITNIEGDVMRRWTSSGRMKYLSQMRKEGKPRALRQN